MPVGCRLAAAEAVRQACLYHLRLLVCVHCPIAQPDALSMPLHLPCCQPSQLYFLGCPVPGCASGICHCSHDMSTLHAPRVRKQRLVRPRGGRGAAEVGVLAGKRVAGSGLHKKHKEHSGRGSALRANAAPRLPPACSAARVSAAAARRPRCSVGPPSAAQQLPRAQLPAGHLAVASFRYEMRSARSSGFFSPANTILVPVSGGRTTRDTSQWQAGEHSQNGKGAWPRRAGGTECQACGRCQSGWPGAGLLPAACCWLVGWRCPVP